MTTDPNSRGMRRLSKSKLAAFAHCPKRLWLQIHRREVGHIDTWTKRLFEAGHRVGELARSQVPNGILIDPNPRNIVAALVETREAMGAQRTLFEPAFIHQHVVVRVDILEPQRDGSWRLIEVKNSSAARAYQVSDVASQAWVLRGAGLTVSGMSIRLPSQVLRPGSLRARPISFHDVDVSAAADRLMNKVQASVDGARRILDGDEPMLQMGQHCTHPFRCEFVRYCSQVSSSS